jgi:hypothetical protein
MCTHAYWKYRKSKERSLGSSQTEKTGRAKETLTECLNSATEARLRQGNFHGRRRHTAPYHYDLIQEWGHFQPSNQKGECITSIFTLKILRLCLR